MLINVKYRVCINIHFHPRFCIFMQKLFFARIFFSVSSAYAHAALAFSPHLHLIIYACVSTYICACADGPLLFFLQRSNFFYLNCNYFAQKIVSLQL